MVASAEGHVSNPDEHEARDHDKHSRDREKCPCPAVRNDRENDPSSKEKDQSGCKDGEEQTPVEGSFVRDRNGCELRELVGEYFGFVAAIVERVL